MPHTTSARAVTVENFIRAESDTYFARTAARGGLATFHHRRAPLRVDQQLIIRGNPDVLMSQAVFDLRAGPLTIGLPDPGGRLMSMQVITQDHFNPLMAYGPCEHVLTDEGAGTRYVLVAVRTTINAASPEDLAVVHRLQDSIRVNQRDHGTLELPDWDPASLATVRDALLVLSQGVPDTRRTFGLPGQVDPVRRLVAAAFAWGGQPEEHAYYLNITPPRNDGETVHRLRLADVPVDGYWSVTVYNEKGFLEQNARDVYTINSFTAQADEKGGVTVQFGGCDGAAVPNCIPIMKGWNYLVRLYRARPEVLDGRWTFPEAQAVEGD